MITFKELEANYESVTAIPYFELIKTKEWFDCKHSACYMLAAA